MMTITTNDDDDDDDDDDKNSLWVQAGAQEAPLAISKNPDHIAPEKLSYEWGNKQDDNSDRGDRSTSFVQNSNRDRHESSSYGGERFYGQRENTDSGFGRERTDTPRSKDEFRDEFKPKSLSREKDIKGWGDVPSKSAPDDGWGSPVGNKASIPRSNDNFDTRGSDRSEPRRGYENRDRESQFERPNRENRNQEDSWGRDERPNRGNSHQQEQVRDSRGRDDTKFQTYDKYGDSGSDKFGGVRPQESWTQDNRNVSSRDQPADSRRKDTWPTDSWDNNPRNQPSNSKIQSQYDSRSHKENASGWDATPRSGSNLQNDSRARSDHDDRSRSDQYDRSREDQRSRNYDQEAPRGRYDSNFGNRDNRGPRGDNSLGNRDSRSRDDRAYDGFQDQPISSRMVSGHCDRSDDPIIPQERCVSILSISLYPLVCFSFFQASLNMSILNGWRYL